MSNPVRFFFKNEASFGINGGGGLPPEELCV